MDQETSKNAPVQWLPAHARAEGKDESGAPRESCDGTQKEEQQGDEAEEKMTTYELAKMPVPPDNPFHAQTVDCPVCPAKTGEPCKTLALVCFGPGEGRHWGGKGPNHIQRGRLARWIKMGLAEADAA